MNTCETCKHWPEVPEKYDGPLHRTCMKIVSRESLIDDAFDEYRQSGGDKGKWDLEESLLPETQAYTVDASSYYSALKTTADFGCVLWEVKE